jgi:hypothetical protein
MIENILHEIMEETLDRLSQNNPGLKDRLYFAIIDNREAIAIYDNRELFKIFKCSEDYFEIFVFYIEWPIWARTVTPLFIASQVSFFLIEGSSKQPIIRQQSNGFETTTCCFTSNDAVSEIISRIKANGWDM